MENSNIDDFLVGDEVGSGYSSKVHRVKYKHTGEIYVIKCIQKSITTDKLVQREIDIQKLIQDGSAPKIYCYFKTENTHCIVMEYLEKCLREFDVLEERVAKQYMKSIFESIKYMHENGIMHRDIKTENVMVHKGKIKIIDFGFSTTSKRSNTLCGTTVYISPEMYKGTYGNSTDIWSAGILMFEILAGNVPFDDKKSIMYGDLNLGHRLSDEAKDLLGKILVKSPTKRIKIHEILAHKWFA